MNPKFKLELSGKFNDGKLSIINRRQFEALSKGLNCDVDIVITKKRKKRSDPQNRYYWACIVSEIQMCLIQSQGEWISKEETHEFLKNQFNYLPLVSGKSGDIVNVPKSTTVLTTTEFEEYQDKCREFALEYFNCIIPLPNEQNAMAL